jgi:hypothetical protein
VYAHGARVAPTLDETRPRRAKSVLEMMEATTGFEPVIEVLQTSALPLGYVALITAGVPPAVSGCPSRIRTSVHGSKVRRPTTERRGNVTHDSLRGRARGSGAEDGTRTRDPHLGKVMLYQLSHFRPILTSDRPTPYCGAESQIRTGDTAIFSRVLYQLSYLGPPVRSRY